MVTLNNQYFDAYGHSLTCYVKEKCGDHLLIHNIEQENILVAIVSDGVGGRPCDWLASELTCASFMEFFLGNRGLQMDDRIRNGVLLANERLLSVEDNCRGLAATAVILVWNYTTSECHFVSIGDSRLYRIRDSVAECLTRDDAHKGRKEYIDDVGKRMVIATKLTNSLGRPHPKITIQKEEFLKKDLLLLMTDGFYEARRFSFEKTISELGNSDDLAFDFVDIFRKWEISAKDDMTAIVIKKVEKLEVNE